MLRRGGGRRDRRLDVGEEGEEEAANVEEGGEGGEAGEAGEGIENNNGLEPVNRKMKDPSPVWALFEKQDKTAKCIICKRDIDIDIDMEKLKISISISISIGQF